MSAIEGARARARREITAAIKEEARRQLAAEGAARLSLRAVARVLGVASSALYRYFPSRDDLLTALIVDAYDAMGAAAEETARAVDRADPAARWVAVCAAAREWALAHPHEYGLVHGTPVPGYAAPRDTVGPASRLPLALLAVVADAHADGLLAPPGWEPLPPAVRAEAEALAAEHAPGLPAQPTAALVAAWAQLTGLISAEVFGQYTGVVTARAEFFGHAVARLAAGIGLPSTRGAAPEE
ncbi:TetR/AcrR family transcriptional regulator [Streptomyces sp. RFCAC02]|uniref:TetR/AcrR family transcriptional regulator n=1 Tax=Streptomyces sp. RFCAC02 TaxID=2499143 RepID=UPI001020B9C4|nr:TetR/AcrR family transcriptional regulator [Streptomyces sp. RFCAC02]